MSNAEISKVLNEEISKLTQNDVVITEEVKIKEIGLNSIDFVKLLVFVEDEFHIIFSDEDLIMSDDICFSDLVSKISNYLVQKQKYESKI